VLFDEIGDILAANDAACFLFDTDFSALPEEQRNSIYWMLTSARARELYAEHWEQTAAEMVGKLRAETVLHPQRHRAQALVTMLIRESGLFREIWKQPEITFCVQGVKTLQHRIAGALQMRSEVLTVQNAPGQVFYLMVPLDDTFEKALRANSGAHRNQ
jgi:PAS domain-containing protein